MMKIELLGAIDYDKLKKELNKRNQENVDDIVEYMRELSELSSADDKVFKKLESKLKKVNSATGKDLIDYVQYLEDSGRAEKVATAGRLSRFAGDIFEVLDITENNTFEENVNFAKRVINMGHDSITDHDYLVFAIKDVSPVIEQTIIAERFSSFTIKSRREVDFSKVGFYTPDFHDENGVLLSNNMDARLDYQKYMKSLFVKYSELESLGLSKEDARFVLPYSYNSNIIMGIDAHTLKDMIIKFTKTHLAKIQELREFGERLCDIASNHCPYILDEIHDAKVRTTDSVSDYLESKELKREYKILDSVKMLNASSRVDDTILVAAIMKRYQYDREKAMKVLNQIAKEDPNFKSVLMHKIVFEGDKSELAQVNFEFQIPLSFAVLTHLTRHRTHHLLVPEFAPNIDLKQYKVPPKAKIIAPGMLEDVYDKNYQMYLEFKEKYGVCDEDLIYFTLSGNMVNVISNMDGKTVEHILGLRECSKAQWETQAMAHGIHKEIDKLPHAEIYSSILGSTCMTQGYCKEGKESCGRLLLQKKDN